MQAPSKTRLELEFGLSSADAKLLRAFAAARDDVEELEILVDKVPATDKYVRSLYNSPYDSRMWRTTVVLHAINEILDGYGVEALSPEGTFSMKAPPYEYINFGDTYAKTLIYDSDKDKLFIGSWGDIVENDPRFQQDDDRDYNPSLKSFLSR